MTEFSRPVPRLRRPTDARLVHDGRIFKVWQWNQELFDGSSTVFEGLSRPDTALIVPLLETGQLVFARESQPGMPSMLRTLGGRVEENEAPDQAARRELLEEAGIEAQSLKLWKAWQPINKIDWAVYLFVALGSRVAGGQSLEGGEKIALEYVPLDTLFLPELPFVFDDYEFNFALHEARSDERGRLALRRLFSV